MWGESAAALAQFRTSLCWISIGIALVTVGRLRGDLAVKLDHEIEKRDAERLAPFAGPDEINLALAAFELFDPGERKIETGGQLLLLNIAVGALFHEQVEEDAVARRELEAAAHCWPPLERGAFGTVTGENCWAFLGF